MHCVYFVVNTTSEKVYVGQSRNWQNRVWQHFHHLKRNKHHCVHLQNAYNSYGKDAFVSYPVDDFATKAEVDEAEKFYIAWFRQLGLSYNHMGGGEGCFEPDAETRRKMGTGWRGKPGPMTGKTHTDEAKAKIKAKRAMQAHTRKGVPHSEETKRKLSEAHMGKTLSEEHKAKVLAGLAKREFTPEYRRKLSEAARGNAHWAGKHHTDEAKRKLSEARKGAGNPAYGKPRSEEARRKTSESLKIRQSADISLGF